MGEEKQTKYVVLLHFKWKGEKGNDLSNLFFWVMLRHFFKMERKKSEMESKQRAEREEGRSAVDRVE